MLILLVSAFSVNAVSPDYDIVNVEVNDIDISGTSFDVERGEELEVEVTLRGDSAVDNVRVEARIDGYEYGRISDVSDVFSVDPGVTFKRTLHLNVPFDIDASQLYTLRIEVFDKVNNEVLDLSLNLDERRHDVNFFDVLASPSTISAGRPLFVTAVLENLGEKKEENIKVTASIPELGVVTSVYLDELVTEGQETNERFDDDEESSRNVDLLLRIPEDANSGEYTLKVDAEFNRGHDLITATKKVTVKGAEKTATEAVVNVDSTSKKLSPGQEVTYKVMVANLGDTRGLFSVNVDGVEAFGSATVEPSFVTVEKDSTGEVLVKVKASDNAKAGNYNFVTRVSQDGKVLRELTMSARVEGPVRAVSGWDDLRKVLTVVFVILVVLLVVLGIVLAYKKMGEEEEASTPDVTQGQTYYYHPKR